MFEIILSVLAGLALFLYAVNSLSETMKSLVGSKSNRLLKRFTKNLLMSVITGLITTIILDSSSAVIILTIVLVNSGHLTFKNAMGIVLGANIGTTISSQIIAMDIGKFSPLFLVSGLILMMISKSDSINKTGRAVLYFGVLFFGLFTMERAVEPLKNSPIFYEWIKSLDSPYKATISGAIITLLIQSSSATVGMAIVLAKKGLLSLAAGVGIMMGAELGTVADTLIATLKGSRQAIKTGIFHLIFNLLSIIAGLILFKPFVELVKLTGGNSSNEHLLANAHVLFNVLGVVLFIGFTPLIERMLNYFIPEKINERISVFK